MGIKRWCVLALMAVATTQSACQSSTSQEVGLDAQVARVIGDFKGEVGGTRVIYIHPETKLPTPVHSHACWWWSEPFPEMPEAPLWDEVPDAPDDKMVTVCAVCHRACCWLGEFMCDESQNADLVNMHVSELRKLDLEHEEYWDREDVQVPEESK